MPSITRSVNVNASPYTLWQILCRHMENPENPIPYQGKPPRIEPKKGTPLTTERHGVGTKTRWQYRFRGRDYIWDDVVTEWIEERKIAWKATSGITLEDYFELLPENSTTTLRYHMWYKAPYWLVGAISERLFYRSAIIENIEWTLQVVKRNAERIASLERATPHNQTRADSS